MREDDTSADDVEDLDEVRERVRAIQASRRGRIRWAVGRHTAELALGALTVRERPRRSSK